MHARWLIWPIVVVLLLCDRAYSTEIDGCAKTVGETTANISVTSSTTKVQFVSCHIGPSTDIIIHIPSPNNGTEIELRDVVVDGGSLTVEPTTGSALDNVHIVVENAIIRGNGDVLVIGGGEKSLDTVSNVTLWINNSVLLSTTGSVASVVARIVTNVHVRIFGNSTLSTIAPLVGSIFTANAFDCSLTLDTSECHGSAQLRGGNPGVPHVGVLSIIQSTETAKTGGILHVENIRIIVTSRTVKEHCPANSAGISMSSHSRHTTSCVGSICVNGPTNVSLIMSGYIDIYFRFSAESHSHKLSAFAQGGHSASSVGGVVVNAYLHSSPSSAKVTLINCSLTLAFNKNSSDAKEDSAVGGNIAIKSAQDNGASASGVCAIVVNTHSNSAPFSETALILENSFVAIGAAVHSLRGESDSVNIVSSTAANAASAGAFAIVANSYSGKGPSTCTVSVNNSSVTIMALIDAVGAPTTPLIGVTAASGRLSVSSAFGIVVSGIHTAGPVGTVGAEMSTSTISIEAVVKGNVVIQSSSGTKAPTSVFGALFFGGKAGTLSASPTARINIWMGATRSCQCSTSGVTDTAITVGLSSQRQLNGITPLNTALSFCGDGTAILNRSSPGTSIAIEPPTPGVSFNKSNLLSAEQYPDSWCSKEGIEVESKIRSILELKVLQNTQPEWPRTITSSRSNMRSSTLSNSGAVSSTSYSSSRTASTRTSKSHSSTLSPRLKFACSTPSATVVSKTRTLAETPVPTIEDIENRTSVAPTAPPTRHTVVTSVMLPGNEKTAAVVVTSAGGANVVASTLGSSGAGVVVVASSALRVMQCGLTEDDPRPATFELPVQFALGSSNVRYYSGAVVAHTLIQLALFAMPFALRRRNRANGEKEDDKYVSFFAMMYCGCHAFFTATVLGGVSTIVFNTADSVSLAVAFACASAIIGLHVLVSLTVHLAPSKGLVARVPTSAVLTKLQFEIEASTSRSSEDSNETSTSSTQNVATSMVSAQNAKYLFLTMFDGCRIFEKTLHRHYATIEVTLTSIVAVISGSRPTERCDVAAYSIALIALLGLVYVVAVRPFRTKLDFIFAVLNNTLLLVLSASVITAMEKNDDSGEPPESTTQTMKFTMWVISAMAILQLLVQGYWAYHVAERRKHSLREDGDHFEKPLLQINSSAHSSTTETNNSESSEDEEEDDDGSVVNPLDSDDT